MVKISPFVKLLRGEYELTIILLLTRLRGKARTDEIIKKGKETKTLPSLNGTRLLVLESSCWITNLLRLKKMVMISFTPLHLKERNLGSISARLPTSSSRT